MRSTLNPRPADDPHDFVVVPPDMVRVVPSDDELSHVLRDAARHLGDTQAHVEPGFATEPPVPAVDTTFRAAAVDDLLPAPPSPFGNLALRGLAAFAFAAFTAAAGIAWQFYGGPAKQVIANWTPLALTSSQASEESAQPPTAVEAAAPVEAPAQPAPAAPTAAEAAATATAALSPDQTQLQSMARDLASAGQQIEQLKASIAELKAGQQQISRELAKASERPRAPASPHAAAPAHTPRQATARTYPPAAAPYMPPPPQAAAPPPADPSVPRPPMPVR